jgi:hypothetical protein
MAAYRTRATAAEDDGDRLPQCRIARTVAPADRGVMSKARGCQRTTFAPVREEWSRICPFRVKYLAATQCFLLQKKVFLKSKLDCSVKGHQNSLVDPECVRIEFVIDAHAHNMVRDVRIEVDSKRC